MSEKRTYECWAVVDGKEILGIGDDEYDAMESFFREKWGSEKRGVRVVRLECREVEE